MTATPDIPLAGEPASGNPEDGSTAGELILKRLSTFGAARCTPPADVAEALGQPSKQFHLWDVERQTTDAARVRGEPVERVRPLETGGGLDRILAESTRALARFIPASVLARKGFIGLRALKRLVLSKPYKPDT